MDTIKEEISMKMLCNACLCIGKTLYQVTEDKLKRYYLCALNEIPLCNMPTIVPALCTDCVALLKKSHDFREQVKDSYRILITYTSENLTECLLTDVSRPPRLRIEKKDSINIAPCSNNAVEIDKEFDNLLNDRDVESSQKVDDSSTPSNNKTKVQTSLKQNKCDILYKNTHVYVKEELKMEDCDSDRDADFDIPLVDLKQCDTLADITDLQTNDGTEYILDKIKKKELKRSKKNAKVKKKKKKEGDESEPPNILTIHMTYEQMMEERQKEMERDSYVKAEFKCESCILGFSYNKSYQKHLLSKHSTSIGKYSCPICKTILATVESFSTHYKRHMKRYECGACGARARDVKRAQQHYARAHRDARARFECARCGHVANTLDAHRYHVDTHKARLACADCDKTFRHRGGLLNHRLTVHEARNRFPCTSCDKVFRWKNSLKRHMPVHDQKNACGPPAAAHCATCRVSFASVGSYRRHLANSLHHVTKDHFRFICDHCNGRFADKTKLRDHIEEKHLHKTFQCSVCLKTFMNRVNLDQHTRNVHRGRPNNKMCHHCGKGFPTKAQLESHIRTHTGERPYICELCPTTFSQHSNLYKHNRQVHLNMKSKRYPAGRKAQSNPIILPLEPPQLPMEYPVHIDFTI